MKILRFFFIAFMVVWTQNLLFAQDYPLEVQINAKPKFTPLLGEFLDNPAEYLRINVKGDGQQREIYLLFKMEQIIPEGNVSIATQAVWRPKQPLVIRPNGLTLIKSADMKEHFSDASVNDFNTVGINLDDYQNYAEASSRIPEGTYQVCVYACDFNEPIGLINPLSDPNAGCAMVQVCYKADAPTWLTPINAAELDITNDAKKIEPKEKTLFSWTSPINTCGANMSKTTYKFKLAELLDGQTIDEAAENNPAVLEEDVYKSHNFYLDTIKYPDLLTKGKTYVAQVTAISNSEAVEIDNNGKSKVFSFVYGEKSEEEQQEAKEEEEENIHVKSSNSDCEVSLPEDQKAVGGLKEGDIVKLGKFQLKISEVTESKDNTFKGKGDVEAELWNSTIYTISPFRVLVEFSGLKVNKDKVAFAGEARGIYKKIPEFNIEGDFSNKYVAKGYNFLKKKLGKKMENGVAVLDQSDSGLGNFTAAATPITAALLETPQALPFGLNLGAEAAGGNNIDVGVSDMYFTPKGGVFSMYAMVKLPEQNCTIGFGAADLCMYDNPFKNGKLMMMHDVAIPMGEDDYKLFLEGQPEGTDGTYVKWTIDGYEGMRLAGRLEFPKDKIKNITNAGKPISLKFGVECDSPTDWVADVSMSDGEEFEFVDLPDIRFKIDKATIDLSDSKNPKGYDDLKIDDYEKPKDFTGVFLDRMQVSLPSWITKKGDNKRMTFAITNSFFNSRGITMNIARENVLNINDGNVGGWGFSIDNIGIQVVESSVREGVMKGKFNMPVLQRRQDGTKSGYLAYTCMIKPAEKNLNYEFRVEVPKDGLEYNFFTYFNAKISEGSNVSLKIADKGPQIAANLNGELGIKGKVKGVKIDVKAVEFEGLRIANYDNDKPDVGFDFDFGTWKIGGINITKGKSKDSKDVALAFLDDGFSKSGPIEEGGISGPAAQGAMASGSVEINKSVSIGSFKAELNRLSFSLEHNNKQYDGYDKAADVTIDIGTTIAMGDFGDDGGKDMASAYTSFGFDIPIAYSMPNKNKENYGLKMPGVQYNAIKMHFNEVVLKGEFGPVAIRGSFALYDDDNKKWGDGWRGTAEVVFPADIKASASVQFGTLKKVKYWYVDAGVSFGDYGLEVGGGTFAINSFGGGVWKNMIQKDDNRKSVLKKLTLEEPKDENTETETKKDSTPKLDDEDLKQAKELGHSFSGCEYIPTAGEERGFGFNAMVGICASKAAGGVNTFNGEVKMTMSFLQKGGKTRLNRLALNGELNAMTTGKGKKGLVNGMAKIEYIHPKKTFEMEINVEAEMEVFKANIPFKLLVNGKEKKWFAALGEPKYSENGCKNSKTVCVQLMKFGEKGDIVWGNLNAQAYFCAGNDIKYGLPEIPEKIQTFLNDPGNLNAYYRKDPKKGVKGFMMGSRINGGFGFEFGPLYASLEAIAGFDVGLVGVNKNTVCAGGGTIEGFNGYYAMGQIYAYIHGETGVSLKFFGSKKKFSLIDIEAGAMLQGGFKDPSWFKGNARIRGSVLHGLVKFNTQARFKIGDECVIEKDPLKDLKIIEAITPGEENKADAKRQEAEASVFTTPKIVANVKMNTPFLLPADEMQKVTRQYRFKADRIKLSEVGGNEVLIENKAAIAGSSWREIRIEHSDALKPNTLYKVEIGVAIQEYRGKIGSLKYNKAWRNPRDGKKVYPDSECRRTDTVYFKTGKMPNYIDENNILSGYPFENQREVFTRDYNGKPTSGRVDFKYGAYVEGLFDNLSPYTDDMFGEFVCMDKSKEQPPIKFHYSYIRNGKGGYITYKLPTELDKGTIYKISFYTKKRDEKEAKFKEKEKSKIVKGAEKEEDDWKFGLQDNTITATKATPPGAKRRGSYIKTVNSSSNSSWGTTNFIGSMSNKGNKGQIGYSKRGNSKIHIPIRKRPNTKHSISVVSKQRDGKGGVIKIEGDATKLNKGSVETVEKILAQKGQKKEYENIFTFYIETSHYNSLKEKLSAIKYTAVKPNHSGSMRVMISDGSKSKNRKRRFKSHDRRIMINFPVYSTEEEIGLYKCWKNGQNALEVSPLCRGGIHTNVNNIQDEKYIKYYYGKYLYKPLSTIFNNASKFTFLRGARPLKDYDVYSYNAYAYYKLNKYFADKVLKNLTKDDIEQGRVSYNNSRNISLERLELHKMYLIRDYLLMVSNLSRIYTNGDYYITTYPENNMKDQSNIQFNYHSKSSLSWLRRISDQKMVNGKTTFEQYWKKLYNEHKQWTKDFYQDFRLGKCTMDQLYRGRVVRKGLPVYGSNDGEF